MATFPHEIDPLTAKPRIRPITGNEMEGGMSTILNKLRALEQQSAFPKELQRLEATSIAGVRGRSSQVIEDIARTMQKQGHQFRAEMLGGSTVRFHMLGRGAAGAKGVGIGATFDVPLQIGGVVRGLPSWLRDPERLAFQQAVRQAEFVARGRFHQIGESIVPATWIESVGQGIQQELGAPAVGDAGLRDTAKRIQKLVTGQGYQGLVWAGSKRLPIDEKQAVSDVMAAGYYARAGSIYDIFQMGTVGIHRGPGIAAPKLIEQFADQSKFPFGGAGGQTFDPSLALRQMQSFLEDVEGLGIQASDRAIKAETAMAGNLGLWGLGEIVPFGETADPSRQAYQRLAIAQLAGRRPRAPAPVSTPTVEAMKRYIGKQAGRRTEWTVESRLALVLDPRFERAVAGSGGGAVISPKLAGQLSADITEFAQYESAKWAGMMERGGRFISKTDVGMPLITSLGTRHTVASIRQMTKANMAIGWSSFLKGKSPEALREAVVRDVMEQVGTFTEKYRFQKGAGRIAYTPEQLARRNVLRRSFLEDVAQVFGAPPGGGFDSSGTGLKIREGMPQLLIGKEATFETSHLERLNESIDRYNKRLRDLGRTKQELGLREIRKGFEIGSLKIGTQRMRAMFMQASIMRRLEAPEIVTKAVGAWTRPAEATAVEGFKPGVSYYASKGQLREVVDDLYHPRGTKLGLKDLTNLELYKTKEADQLAELYKKYIDDWASFEKEQLHGVRAFFGVPGQEMSAVGFPEFKGAIELSDFARKYGGKYQPSTGGVEKTAAELAGTIFDPKDPLRQKSLAIKLPWEIEIGGVPRPGAAAGEIMEGIPTRQLYLPAPQAYRGILRDPSILTPETAAYLGKLERAHERLFLNLAATNPEQAKVEMAARKYYNILGQSFSGKSGLWSYLSTARMAHSGYFGLVPGGTGPSAKALGTALDNPFISHISETSAKELGVYDFLRKSGKGDPYKGTIYGRVSAYPGIGPTMESVLRFKMVKDTELGAKRLRLSNAVALTMFRDFDMDKAGVTFLTGERAQHLSEQFYKKTMIPRVRQYADILKDDPELATILTEDSPYYRQLAEEVQGIRNEARDSLMGYGEMVSLAEAKTAKVQGKLFEAIERKYTTKALTGPVNWYLTQFRLLAQQPGITKDAARLGLQNTNFQMVGGILGLVEQQAAITKGKEVAGGVQGIFRLLGTQFDMQTEAGREAFEGAVKEGERYLFQMSGAERKLMEKAGISEVRAVGAGLGYRGEYGLIGTREMREKGMRQLLSLGQVRREIMARGELRDVYPQVAKHMAKGAAEVEGLHVLGSVYADIAERQAALSGEGMAALNQASENMTKAGGYMKAMGLEWGTDVAGIQAREARVKAERAAMAEINQAAKETGRRAGMTVLDRASQWWTRAETPYWQKAGVVTGAAILLGSVAKNALFPGYGTDRVVEAAGRPAGPPPVIIAAPPTGEAYRGPTGPPVAPHRAHQKPGGLWAYVQEQVGFGPESYGLDTGRGQMPMAKPIFGPRKHMPGVGLDVGPGIADSDYRPMMLTGPPVGGGAPLPPAIPSVERGEPQIPYTTPLGEPPARMQSPEFMRPGMMVSGIQPAMSRPGEDLMNIMQERLGGEVNLLMDRWDPGEGIIDRMMSTNSEEMSSFV